MANVTVWCAIALSFASAQYAIAPGADPFILHVAYALAGWAPWILLTAALTHWLPVVLRRSTPAIVVTLLAASIVWMAVYSPVLVAVQTLFAGAPFDRFVARVTSRPDFWLWFDYTYFWAVVAVVAAVHFQRARREALVRAQRLRERVADVELRYRVAQLQPHFLFNALNGIAGLVRSGASEPAAEAIDEISELLRAALEFEDVPWVPLERELELLRSYLRIHELRFDERVELTLRIAPDAADARVPPMILQPLVENAVEHGARASSRSVGVSASRESGCLILEVDNDGELADRAEGVGLANVRARLEAGYGAAASLRLSGADGRVRATLRIPADAGIGR